MAAYKVGVLTISDRCSQGLAENKSGPLVVEAVNQHLGQTWIVTHQAIVPDEKDLISHCLIDWSDNIELALILTTGGTGFAPRDVTPEATKDVIEKEAPGLVQAMMAGSLNVTPMAMLSRLTAGIRKQSLIINLPGNPKGALENFGFVIPALKHGIDVLLDHKVKVNSHHEKINQHVCGHHKKQDGITSVAARPRKSPYPMITVDEAQKIVIDHCKAFCLETEEVLFKDALHRVLAEDVKARDPLPPFPASIKDGYAVIASDKHGLRQVIGASNAGNEPKGVISPGQCVRINTGAPVPNGADAVVQVEDTELVKSSDDGNEELVINILVDPQVGQDIRTVGSDIENGSVVLTHGSVLGPAEIGLLATVGAIKVKVFKKPQIALLSTGNELQDPGEGQLKLGYIRDSNKATLMCLIESENGFRTIDCGIATDDLDDLKTKLSVAFDRADLIVTTGGVSMGDRDLIRQVLVQEFDAQIHFGRVQMKPGKPTTFSTLTWKNKPKMILGLPGNPVSATVTSHLYVLPAARALSGYTKPFSAKIKARLDSDVVLDPRPEYYRVSLIWDGQDAVAKMESTGNQISSRLASLRAANGLMLLPPRTDNKTKAKAGEVFDTMVIGQLFS